MESGFFSIDLASNLGRQSVCVVSVGLVGGVDEREGFSVCAAA